MKGQGILYKKMKRYFQKLFFKNFRPNFRKITYLHKNACFSFIINSRIIIRISNERAWHPLHENEAIFSKKYIFSIFDGTFEKLRSWLLLLCYFAYQVKGIDILYKKIKCYFRKKKVRNFQTEFSKKIDVLLTRSSLLTVK